MNKIILFLILLTYSKLMASSVMFQSLSYQSCLYTLNNEELLLASFNDGKASRISRGHIEELIQSAEKISGIENLEQKSVYLHCGAYGSSLIFNLQQADRGLCLWVGHQKGQLHIKDIGPISSEQSGFCDGFKAGSLLFIYSKIMSLDEVKVGLEESGVSDKIIEIAPLSQKIYKIKLKKEYAFDVLLLKKDIQIDDIPYLKSIEAENLYHPIGEYQLLDWP